MTPKQSKENFDWFMSKIPERMRYFRNRCAEDLCTSAENLDYSSNSLKSVWKWFIGTAKIEKTPKRDLEQMEEAAKIFGSSYVNKEQFTVATQFILRDIGMYLGQAYVLNYKPLYWTFYTKPKNDINVNQPVIAGFTVNGNNTYFNPIHMAKIQAANIFNHTAQDSDLYKIFVKWATYVA